VHEEENIKIESTEVPVRAEKKQSVENTFKQTMKRDKRKT